MLHNRSYAKDCLVTPWLRLISNMLTLDGLTVRISNLPSETDWKGNDIRRIFDGRVGQTGSVVSRNGIGQVVTQAKRRTKQTTVTFMTFDLKKKALEKCHRTAFSAEHGNGTVIVDVEDEFMGLTTLYIPESETPNIEWVSPSPPYAWHEADSGTALLSYMV